MRKINYMPISEKAIRWPIWVTVPDGKGGIRSLEFKDRRAADLAGYNWIGRSSSSGIQR